MRISSIATVAIFLLFIAPGLLSTILASGRRGDSPQTAFRELGSTVLSSLIYTGISTFLVMATFLITPALSWSDANQLASDPAYLRARTLPVALVVIMISAIACGLVALVHLKKFRTFKPKTQEYSGWFYAFENKIPSGTERMVYVHLKNDYAYSGVLASYSSDHKLADREIVLAGPVHVRPPTGEEYEANKRWQRVVIRGDEIAMMGVGYKKRNTSNMNGPKGKTKSSNGARNHSPGGL